MARCKWIRDPEVPGGRFLVPGCWNRAVHGDHAECHCRGGEVKPGEEIEQKLDAIIKRLDKLEGRL